MKNPGADGMDREKRDKILSWCHRTRKRLQERFEILKQRYISSQLNHDEEEKVLLTREANVLSRDMDRFDWALTRILRRAANRRPE